MRLPKLFRKKRSNGRYTGNWRAKVDGEELNLGTTDATEARARLVAAVQRGKRNFESELDETAEAMELAAEQEAAAAADARQVTERETVSRVPSGGFSPFPPSAAASHATADPVPGSTPGAPPNVQGGAAPAGAHTPGSAGSTPAPATDPEAEAAATAAAAAETIESSIEPANDNAKTAMDPDVLRSLVEQGAHVVVEGQLWLQGWIVERSTGKKPLPIPIELRGPNNELILNPATGKPLESPRQIAARAWVAQFEKWFPNLDLPEWAIALVLTGMYLPAQMASAMAAASPASPGKPSDSGESAAA